MSMTVSDNYDLALQDMKHRIEEQRRVSASLKKVSRKQKNKRKKKVSYDAREIPALLTRTTHSMGAGQVLVRANSKLQSLQMCLASGEYDLNELRAAINHAKRMVKCARKKLKNLQEEENVEGQKRKKNPGNDVNRERIAKMKLERKLSKLRRRHRGDEQKEMEEAKHEYLREKANAERAEAYMAQAAAAVGTEGTGEAGDAGAEEMADLGDPPSEIAAVSVDVCL